jgi:chromosome segregation ATPase
MKKQTTHLRTADQKEFVKKFNALCGAHSRWEVWSDFVQMSAIAISNAVDKANAPERVKAFQTMASKYSDMERNALAELLAELVAGMEANSDRDYLGAVYMTKKDLLEQIAQYRRELRELKEQAARLRTESDVLRSEVQERQQTIESLNRRIEWMQSHVKARQG